MNTVDVVIIGSGPAGQKAAIQLSLLNYRVVLCEQLKEIRGACVHQDTIPSKALRERAIERGRVSAMLVELNRADLDREVSVAELIGEMSTVVCVHDQYMTDQLVRNGIKIVHGRASFVSDKQIDVLTTAGERERFQADYFVIAAVSKPRRPDRVEIDHENIYDSDSVLTLAYLPQSMVVLGGACNRV